ncbi:MAG: serine/threonine-protein kinase [Pirellulales bacterium]
MRHEPNLEEFDRLAPILAEYLTRIDRGDLVSREAFLAENPEHCADLQQYFSDVDLIERLATKDSSILPSVTADSSSSAKRAGVSILREFGGYDLLHELGRGGMGIVYRARERSTGRIVALKMLLHGRFMSPEEVLRFRNEARTAAALRHPGIVPIYHVGEYQGQLFFTMPLIAGSNLAERLATGPLEPTIAAELLLAVADAVADAHSGGVVHRDLKPANILLDERDRPYVADFGLARRLDEEPLGVTLTGDLLGTPNYMAPEQVNGPRALVGPATDVYAMGAVLYAMLIGQPPFHSDSVAETLLKIGSSDPAPPRQVNRRVPRDLETIGLKCLEKSPANRYHSASELAADLRRFLTGEPLFAQRISRVERGRRWFVRNPVVGTLAVGIGLALIAGTGFSMHYAQQAHEREQLALANLYAADMNLAQQHMRSGAVASAVRLLERHRVPPDAAEQQGWEWRHLWHQCHSELRRFEGPQGAVLSVAVSPDGRTVAAAGADRKVWLWDMATGKVKHKLAGHTATVRDLAFSPDGGRLASVGDDGVACIWETATGKWIATLVATGGPPVALSAKSTTGEPPVATLSGHARPLTSVDFSADGRFIATGGNDEANVTLWDASSYALLHSLELGPAESLSFAPGDGCLVLAGRDGRIRVCQFDESGTWTIAATIQAHADVIHDLAWSPDGTRLATAGADAVKLWDANTWRELPSLGPLKESAYSINFSPDGRRLVAAIRNEPLKAWNIDQPQNVTEMVGHSALVTSVDYCPDGWRLVSASEDGTVRLWDAAKATDHDRLEGHLGQVRTVAFSPDGKTLASGGGDGAVILWNPDTCDPLWVLRSHSGNVNDLAFSPDGKYLAVAEFNGHLRIWHVETGRKTLDLSIGRGSLVSVAWTPDGSRAAVQTIDGAIRIVEVSSGREITTWSSQHGQAGNGSIAFSTDASLLVTAGGDQSIRVWNTATRELVHELQGHTAPVVSAVFDPQGTIIASASNDHTIRLWSALTGRHLRTLTGHGGTPQGLAFTADGKRLASSSTDQTVKLWDVATGLELQSLVGHTDWARDVAFSSDGRQLASAGHDGTVRIWHAANETASDRTTTREAAALVNHLATLTSTRDSLVFAIEADKTINDHVRAAALRQAETILLHWPSMMAGHRAADRREWATAADAFERVTDLAPDDVMHWHWLAMASLAAGQHEAYQSACDELLRSVGDSPSNHDLFWTLRTWLVAPHDVKNLAKLSTLADAFARQFPEPRTFPWLYELRNGKTTRDILDSTPLRVTLSPQPGDWYVLAMIWFHRGDKAQAMSAYQAGARQARSGSFRWDVDLFHETLRREVGGLLGIEPTPEFEPATRATAAPASTSDLPSPEAPAAPLE